MLNNKRLWFWALLPIVLWFSAANAAAHYFTSQNYWSELRHEALVIYTLISLYIIPWSITVVTGFMIWGACLSAHGLLLGTGYALIIWITQWLTVAGLTYVSISWHYVYFFNPSGFV